MSNKPVVFNGVIQGRTIELDEESGLPNGQRVTVLVSPTGQTALEGNNPRERLKRAAGSWSDDVQGLDEFLYWNREQRKAFRREALE